MKYLSFILLSLLHFTVSAQTVEQQSDTIGNDDTYQQIQLAIKYLDGDSLEQDIPQAIAILTDAANKGNAYSQALLGDIYTDYNYKSVDYNKAFHFYSLAADNGEPYAQMQLANMYRDGHGTTRDVKRAFELMSSAVSNNDELLYAKLQLAQYYYAGWGTERNSTKAIDILTSLKGSKVHLYANKYLDDIKGDTISVSNYDFQFRWLPSVLFAYAEGNADESLLTDVYGMQLYFEKQMVTHFDFEWKEISAIMHHCKNDIDIILYEMPYPQRMPLCLYIAALIDRKDNTCKYFTLEKTLSLDSDDDNFMFCGVAPQSHLNYGMYDGKKTPEAFIERVLDFYNNK
ncbi:MAG: sel1 repeat family protein [Marinilabiliaceae bacterium]|nr:sel1 repeat family protein [Marinilabiliaceae bacterium]